MKRQRWIYIIGPMTGKPNRNIDEFERVRRELDFAGHASEIPHDFIPEDCTRDEAMRISIEQICHYQKMWWKKSGIAMLDGMDDSEGATLEQAVAEACGIPCKPWREWL